MATAFALPALERYPQRPITNTISDAAIATSGCPSTGCDSLPRHLLYSGGSARKASPGALALAAGLEVLESGRVLNVAKAVNACESEYRAMAP